MQRESGTKVNCVRKGEQESKRKRTHGKDADEKQVLQSLIQLFRLVYCVYLPLIPS